MQGAQREPPAPQWTAYRISPYVWHKTKMQNLIPRPLRRIGQAHFSLFLFFIFIFILASTSVGITVWKGKPSWSILP
jgi:hypothetical protein